MSGDSNRDGEETRESNDRTERDSRDGSDREARDRTDSGAGDGAADETATDPGVPGCGPDCGCHPTGDDVPDAPDSVRDGFATAADGGRRSEATPTSSGERSETDGGVDSDQPASAPATPDPEGHAHSGYDPVDVFADADDMDLRPGADNCYKCSVCDTNCPVAEVDDDFPGPKFQGPEQWRLRRSDPGESRPEHGGGEGGDGGAKPAGGERSATDSWGVDPSIEKCSSCMRCDHACPTDVPLAQMHNTARANYVEHQVPTLSRNYLRRKVLANYHWFARLASYVPRLANVVLNLAIVQWVNERVLMVTSERDFPRFSEQTFTDWWEERGGAQVQSEDKRVAYFHGDYAQYNTPEVGKALVRVYEHFGYEVAVPRQRCSGTPMFANGMLDDAERAASVNVAELAALIEDGYDVVASCTSCSMSLKDEYPQLFDLDGVEDVSAHTYQATQYLRLEEDLEAALEDTEVDWPDLTYHAPCHARNQGVAEQSLEVGNSLDGVEIEDAGESCSGISGTWGWKREHYENSMAIGEEMFEHMEDADAETGLTECPTCALQMEHGTGYEIKHPMQLLESALVDGKHAGGDASGYE